MKIQAIAQNIRPMGLNTESSNKYMTKTNQADSFEKSNVAFKGVTAADVDDALKETMKSWIFAAANGDKGKLGWLCKDQPTLRATLVVLKELMESSARDFWEIANGKSFPTREENVNAMVPHYNAIDNAISFWKKLREEGSPAKPFIEAMQQTQDQEDLILPIYDYTDDMLAHGRIMSGELRQSMSVEEWVGQFLS